MDLCAACLGHAFCNYHEDRELSIADVGPKARHGESLRAGLPATALKWIDAVRSDLDYQKIKKARRSLTHARLPRHWNFILSKKLPQRLELQIDEATRLGPRVLIELARDVATKHVSQLLKGLEIMSSESIYGPCTHVFQDWPLDSCFQACLESFLIDYGSRRSQKKMIDVGKANGLCNDKGVVRPEDLQKFCALFEIDFEKIQNATIPPRKVERGEGVLMGCWEYEKGVSHCVRFCGYLNEEKFRVMDPAPVPADKKYPEFETKQIEKMGCEFFRIRLKDYPKMGAVSS